MQTPKNDAAGAVTIPLQYPVNAGGKQIDAITVTRPKLKTQLAAMKAPGSDADKEVVLFASLTGLTPDQLGELDMVDYTAIQKAYKGFLSSASQTSE